MVNRIIQIRKQAGLSQKKFADRMGLSRNFINQAENGKKNFSERTLKDICREFKVNYLWLTEGIEPMYEELDTSSMARIDNIMTGENEFAKNVFREFSKLDENEWKIIEKIIKNLSDNVK